MFLIPLVIIFSGAASLSLISDGLDAAIPLGLLLLKEVQTGGILHDVTGGLPT